MKSIAVVGSGIAGNSAALALCRNHRVTLFEKRAAPGGHAATVDIRHGGRPVAVDTGFIVYNELNYPLLTRLFDHLGVATRETEMSFAVSLDNGDFEWCGSNFRSIFAQKSNLYSPGFLLMLGDILRFNARARRDLADGALCGMSFGDYMRKNKFSARLRDDYIVPMTAAIWSTPAARMLDFPAESLIRFLDNHRLIHFRRPVWRTVAGGSRNYVRRMLSDFSGRLRLDTEIAALRRADNAVYLRDRRGTVERFDAVVLAGHTDETLALLDDPDPVEREILSAVPYRPNRVWLHCDPALMPSRREAWAAWNYLGTRAATLQEGAEREITVTYWMNQLQGIDPACPLFITLNPRIEPRQEHVFGVFDYAHPQFDAAALAAQKRLPVVQGKRNTYFCGAWTRFGFHEDGLASGLEVAAMLGCGAPWAVPSAPVGPARPRLGTVE